MEKVSVFLSKWKNINSIEIVSDFYVSDSTGIVIEGNEMGVTKSTFKELTKYSIVTLENDFANATLVGCLIGSHDDRFFILREKITDFNFEDELHICHIGLTANPKCPGAFARIHKLLSNNTVDQKIIQKEIDFCNFLTTKRPRNYNLWLHRLWLYNTYELGAKEYEWVKEWAHSHPSDYSAFSYLEHVMPKEKRILECELKKNTEMIFEFPGHESLWNYRRFLLTKLGFKKPENWKKLPILVKEIEYPTKLISSRVTEAYNEICRVYGIRLNLVPGSEENKELFNSNLSHEDLLVQVALSDDFPTEFVKQMSAARKYYHWLHSVL